MDGRSRSSHSRCNKCGHDVVVDNRMSVCQHCLKLQKLQPLDVLYRLATFVGFLPQSYFDVLGQLTREYRCMGCRSVNFGEIVTCETCKEHRYCSFPCLQAHKQKHTPVCLHLLIAKGESTWSRRAPLKDLLRIFVQAKTLDDTENADFLEVYYSGWLQFSVVGQGSMKQANINTFMKTPTDLIPDITSCGNKEHFHHKSPEAEMSMKRVMKMKRMTLDTKKQNETFDVDSVIATVNNKILNITEQAKNDFVTFECVEMVVFSGNFGSLCDSGADFGKGWWKHLSSSKPRKKALVIEVKPFAAVFPGIAEPACSLTFSDFYDDSDSEEVQQKVVDTCDKFSSPEISSELTSTSFSIGQNLTTATSLDDKQQLQDTSNPLTLVSESTQQMQVLPVSKTTAGKQNRIWVSETKLEICDQCMLCYYSSNNLKTCARCGYAKYCSKSCQKKDFYNHKETCKKMREVKRAMSMIPSIVAEMLKSKYGTAEISFFCNNVPLLSIDMHHVHALVKIIDVTIPKLGTFVITVEPQSATSSICPVVRPILELTMVNSRGVLGGEKRIPPDKSWYDGYSSQETLCLQHPLPHSMFHVPDFGMPVLLQRCLQPGNYILLIDVHLVGLFFDEILVCNDEQCFFILMN